MNELQQNEKEKVELMCLLTEESTCGEDEADGPSYRVSSMVCCKMAFCLYWLRFQNAKRRPSVVRCSSDSLT